MEKVSLIEIIKKFNKKNKVFLVGNFGNGNLGDEILLYSITRDINKVSRVVYVVGRDKALIAVKDKDLVPVTPTSVEGIIAFFKSNIIVFGPGGLFGKDIGPVARLIPFAAVISKLLGKKVIFYGFGIYKNTSQFTQYILPKVLNHVDSVTVRDQHSFDLLKPKLQKGKLKLIADPAFLLENSSILKSQKTRDNQYKIGVSLRYLEDTKEREVLVSSLSQAFLKLNTRKIRVVPLNFYIEPKVVSIKRSHPSDSEMINLLRKSIKEKIEIEDNDEDLNIDSIFKKYKTLDYVIAMRLHSQILAILNHIPLFSIGYSPKNELSKNYKNVNFAYYSELEPEFLAKDIKQKLSTL